MPLTRKVALKRKRSAYSRKKTHAVKRRKPYHSKVAQIVAIADNPVNTIFPERKHVVINFNDFGFYSHPGPDALSTRQSFWNINAMAHESHIPYNIERLSQWYTHYYVKGVTVTLQPMQPPRPAPEVQLVDYTLMMRPYMLHQEAWPTDNPHLSEVPGTEWLLVRRNQPTQFLRKYYDISKLSGLNVRTDEDFHAPLGFPTLPTKTMKIVLGIRAPADVIWTPSNQPRYHISLKYHMVVFGRQMDPNTL